jgi:hypothetical protein
MTPLDMDAAKGNNNGDNPPAAPGSSVAATSQPRRTNAGHLHRAYVHVADTFLDLFSAFVVWAQYLITFETLLQCVLTLGCVAFYTKWYSYAGQPLNMNVNWTFFSFAVVFPLTFSLNEAFRRRELALSLMAQMKSCIVAVYFAHRDWDWATKTAMSGGRAALPPGHTDEVRRILLALNADQMQLLQMPNVSRSRHFYTSAGRHKRARIQGEKAVLLQRINVQMCRLSAAVEEMKAAGLPGNEAARIRQYFHNLLTAWESLRNVKRYRTPVTTRVFARLYIMLHPFIMGPYYTWIALGGSNSGGRTNFAFAVMLAEFTTLALSALFNIRYALEDPFTSDCGIDSINVLRDMQETERTLQCTAAGGPLFDDGVARDTPHSILSGIKVTCA